MRLTENSHGRIRDGNMRESKITASVLLIVLFIGCISAVAMDRWSALSMIESGDNDAAIGPAGEVSRFQIQPMLWSNVCVLPTDTGTNPAVALHVAQTIMRERCAQFESKFGRPPTDFEFYVLWNAPSQIRRPGKRVSERANRFCNLIASDG